MELLTVNAVLEDAEAKQFTSQPIKDWLDELKDAVYRAEDIVDEIATEASKWKIGSRVDTFEINKINEIIDDMSDIASLQERLGLKKIIGLEHKLPPRVLTDSLPESLVYGREKEKQEILKLLLAGAGAESEDKISVIPIVGMGGLGKTTLARVLYNDDQVNECFKRSKAWVCVTEDMNILRITTTILESITSEPCHITNLDSLRTKLKEKLTGKKFLLVLDDVWNEDYSKWVTLLAPFSTASVESKIIVTTRNETVASVVRTTPTSHNLNPLSYDDSWLLFANHAFQGQILNLFSDLEEIGKKIVDKCGGLPLALITLGGALRTKRDPKEWENICENKIWNSSQAKSEILPALILSYHYLPTHLKRCFAYCSTFLKDHEFDKNELIRLWMAEGFLQQTESHKSLEELGEEFFDELLSRSFFQKPSADATIYLMHDLLNDLAQHVSDKFCFRLESTSKEYQVSKKVRHFSYSKGGDYHTYNKFKPLEEAEYLRTFLPLGSPTYIESLTSKVIRDLVPKMRFLRVLSFSSYTNFVELPDSICNLMRLRYLDLSWTKIKNLPDTICQLYNLETLILTYCQSLVKLPSNMGELVNLRHLDINGTEVKKMPQQTRRLKNLRTLSTFIVGKENESGLRELKELRHIKGSLSIMNLQNVMNKEDVMEANLSDKESLQELKLEWTKVTEDIQDVLERLEREKDVLESLKPCSNLKRLELNNYGGTSFPNWLGNNSLLNLTEVKISNCSCFSLPPLGQLKSLVELELYKIKNVKVVGPEFYYGSGPSSISPFQKLKILRIENMSEWEEWSNSSGDDNDDFPNLQELYMRDCSKLRGKLPNHLSSLRILYIEGCKQLTAPVPEDASLLHTLDLYGCQQVLFTSMNNLTSLHTLTLNECEQVLFTSMNNLTSLRSLEISPGFSEEVTNSFPDGMNMIQSCTNVQELTIFSWSSLINFSTFGFPASIRQLYISYCNNLKFLPNDIFHDYIFLHQLYLIGCDSITLFPLGSFPKLKRLNIYHCSNLESFSVSDNHQENLKSLEDLTIRHCHKLVSFPSGGLPVPNLKKFQVENCRNLRSLPEQMSTLLGSLTELRVLDCPQLETFPNGGLPPGLREIKISHKLVVQTRECHLQRLPCLTKLRIERCKELESFPQEWTLPTSITTLVISDCINLKCIDQRSLLNLTSLQTLHLRECPKLQFSLENNLPTSFFRLMINGCPLMKQQLQKDKVDFIPCLEIDDQVFI